MYKSIFTIILSFFSLAIFAQYGNRDSNRIGITVGVNQFNIKTSNFETTPGNGWNAGLSVRGNFYNDWDAIYGIQFSEYNMKVVTLNPSNFRKETNYKLSAAQLSFLFSYKIVENHLSIELGPSVQVNDKFKIDDVHENYKIAGNSSFTAKDLTTISKFNFYPVVGFTAGVKHVRLNVSYQYGLNNMLSGLNGSFKGNASVLNGNLVFYF